jgi:outer membrane autotransporter protein
MTTRPPFRPSAVGLCFAALAVAGPACSSGGGLHPVRGQLTVNGEPAGGAIIVFHPEGGNLQSVPPTAVVAADGTFTLATGDKAGAPAGSYVVTVTWADTSKKLTEQQVMMGANPYDGPDRLKGRYASPQQSLLRAEVKPGENRLPPFELK